MEIGPVTITQNATGGEVTITFLDIKYKDSPLVVSTNLPLVPTVDCGALYQSLYDMAPPEVQQFLP